MNKVDALERRIEREFMRVGRELAIPVHDRIRVLIKGLRPTFNVTGLNMSMGMYSLEGDDFTVICDDDSTGPTPMSDLLDFDDGKSWAPVGLTKRMRVRLIELRETLDYLTDAPYLPLLQLKAKDLR